ncbi:MAG: hypothetical protein KF881_14355 [Acidobacteria bacterium]|nr:hypothetical protein [Acidobacteriota bacterium]
MATYKDPESCFAPLEVIERLLQFRAISGFSESLHLESSNELADLLDAFGFDSYAFARGGDEKIRYGEYTSPIVPGGDSVSSSFTAH